MRRERFLLFVFAFDRDCKFFNSCDGLHHHSDYEISMKKGEKKGECRRNKTYESSSDPITLDDDMRTDTIFNELFRFPQEFRRQQSYRSSTVSNFCILCPRDIYQRFRCGMNDIQEFEDGCTIVRDGGTS